MPPPAQEPILERICAELQTKLATISQANGFYTNAGSYVSQGQYRPPLAQWNGTYGVWVETSGETPVPDGEGHSTQFASRAHVSVWVYVHESTNARREMLRVLADVKRIFVENSVPLGLAMDTAHDGWDGAVGGLPQDKAIAELGWTFDYAWDGVTQ